MASQVVTAGVGFDGSNVNPKQRAREKQANDDEGCVERGALYGFAEAAPRHAVEVAAEEYGDWRVEAAQAPIVMA